MKALKTKKVWVPGDWTSGMQAQFNALKELFCREGGPVRAHPMVPDGEKAGEFYLMTDWSAHVMAGVLHQVQDGKLSFIAAPDRKCKSYEANYHSSKGELAALHYAVENFEKWLQLEHAAGCPLLTPGPT